MKLIIPLLALLIGCHGKPFKEIKHGDTAILFPIAASDTVICKDRNCIIESKRQALVDSDELNSRHDTLLSGSYDISTRPRKK